jgi:GH15 family glucan-1,4-alpha-glucosidase
MSEAKSVGTSVAIEDYALIGNTHTAALVGRDGSIDWLCMPRFDSGACFAALLGTRDHGRWLIAPVGEIKAVRRKYRGDTLVLETEFELAGGERVAVIDFMPICEHGDRIDLIRVVEGRGGTVSMQMEAAFRFDYGRVVPWVRSRDYGLSAVAGPDALQLRTRIKMHGENLKTVAVFEVAEGERIPFTLTWYPSHLEEPGSLQPLKLLSDTEKYWSDWSARCKDGGPWRPQLIRSLITLKALTFSPTGGIVAAPTTSLPEWIGSVRNWDYRYCWLRDATFTLYALLSSGYSEEALAWGAWLLRAIAGEPAQIQIMYGIAGERRLTEFEAPWLPGYENSSPVRIGNAAHDQFQLDVYGEVMDAFHVARRYGVEPSEDVWNVVLVLMDFVEQHWLEPDEGIWEVRGPRRHFTHSKVMAWVAVDRAVKAVEQHGMKGPLDKWRALRDTIHADVCRYGFRPDRNAFVQYYGADTLDASVLMMSLVGFLPARDPRIVGTIEAIQRDLMDEGLVRRYNTIGANVDGLPPGEGAFLPCTFWLVDNLAMLGRYHEAHEIFDRLLTLCNDVGLLSEEYDPRGKRQLGNFPQAFTHVFLINTIHNLSRTEGPAEERAKT